MQRINVYVSSNNVLTLATNEINEKFNKETGEIEKTSQPTKLVGYMEAALVETLEL